MRIVKLTAENFKRLKAVEITPDGNTVIVRGKNAQGKSSVLDAIAAALGGKALCPEQPIRNGEERAEITVDLGEYIVTRTFTVKDSYLSVKSADGAKIANPQQLLDSLIGSISFDPLEFARMKPADQAKQLADITGVDFAALNKERAELYAERTVVNRNAKSATIRVAEAEKPLAELRAEDYTHEISIDGLNAEYRSAFVSLQQHHNTYKEKLNGLNESRNACVDRIELLKKQLENEETRLVKLTDAYNAQVAFIEESAQSLPDLDEITERIDTANSYNLKVRAFRNAAEYRKELEEVQAVSGSLTARIEGIDERKANLIATADLPVNNLTFDENGVFYQDVPFVQCSSSEQLKVSTALAISLNPKLRVIRITDGSLLDAESLTVLESIANAEDFQIWIEQVDDNKEGGGILIEDGEVVS